MTSNPQLTFGPLNFYGGTDQLGSPGYMFTVLATNTDFGTPVPIEQRITSWLQDGAIVALQGYDNRQIPLQVKIKANDSEGLALGEQALMDQTGRPNLLIWTPPDGAGAPCVFVVAMSHIDPNFDDAAELRLERKYNLTIEAEPFVRALDPVTVSAPAPTGAATITDVAIYSTATNWTETTRFNGGAPVTGSLAVTPPPIIGRASSLAVGTTELHLTRTSIAQSLSGTPFLKVVVDTFFSQYVTPVDGGLPVFLVNGTVLVPVAQYGQEYWLDTTPLGVITLNTLEVYITGFLGSPYPGTVMQLTISDVARSDLLSSGSTNRQLARTLPIAGSARTQGNLLIADTSGGGSPTGIGDVLVYTCPASPGLVQPNLRQFLTSGNSESSAPDEVSSFTTDMVDLHTFDVPAAGLQPGGHLLLARIAGSGAADYVFTWAARSRTPDGALPTDADQSGTTTVDLGPDVGVFKVVTIAMLNLPPRKLGPGGLVRIELTGQGSPDSTLDEAWLFNIDTGRLTWVDCGTGGPLTGDALPTTHLWLDAANLDSPAPTVWRGTLADRSDSFHVADEMKSFGNHEFIPKKMNVFTITTESVAADLTLTQYPRYNSYVVQPADA